MTPPVTQAARDAAADLLHGGRSAIDTYTAATIQSIRDGRLDSHTWVRAFAKAIAEETERLTGQLGPIAAAIEKTATDMDYAVAGGMAWIDHSEAKEFSRRLHASATAIRATVGEVGNG